MTDWRGDLAYVRLVGPDEERFRAAVQRVWERLEATGGLCEPSVVGRTVDIEIEGPCDTHPITEKQWREGL